jgi:hypothetical protein
MLKSTQETLVQRGTLLLLAGVGAALLPTASGCQKKSDDLGNCDVPALFQSSCAGSACHGAEDPRAGLDLVSPGLDRRLFHVQGTSDCDNRKLVFPGSPEDSLLYIKVSEKNPFCGKRMPLDESLSSSELACIRDYIRNAGSDTDVVDCETCGTIQCIDFQRDALNCGACNQPCGEGMVCGGGQCIDACLPEQTQCGNSCVLVDSDDAHCGACDHRCGPGSSCEQGVCICDPNGVDPGGAGAPSVTPAEEVSFAQDILPLFEAGCGGTGAKCHATAEHEAPLGLDPATAYEHLVGVASEDCSGKTLVVARSPDQSYLVDKLMGGALCAGGRMPLGGDAYPSAGTRTIVTWICAGAQNN